MLPGPSSFPQDQTYLDMPAIMAGVDDWAFQGVDMTFLDGLDWAKVMKVIAIDMMYNVSVYNAIRMRSANELGKVTKV
ncbi:hypothetical protein BPAE_0001g00470 [Botrytis paeoniae]|uniref:Uncharacterized protein n=1 Tax=Botrytis paeoniae TaxID=278948 RepID=A0A4Z1GAC1_9HELO|nr:hypothetical protein BPAE_0001g00470 [Botrytis paeoniae]